MSPRLKDLAEDPILGVEYIRRVRLNGISKPAYYGEGGIYRELPIIKISARRRGVRQSDLERVLAARTHRPQVGVLASPASQSDLPAVRDLNAELALESPPHLYPSGQAAGSKAAGTYTQVPSPIAANAHKRPKGLG
jgi:hypothetical protein